MVHRITAPLAALLIVVGVGVGCARDVHTRFPSEAGAEVGTVELAFTAPAGGVSVAVNGVMVVRGARTERITIADVPTGFAELAVAAGPGEKQFRVWVDAGKHTAVPLGAVDETPLTALRSFALSMASLVVYTLLR